MSFALKTGWNCLGVSSTILFCGLRVQEWVNLPAGYVFCDDYTCLKFNTVLIL